jgi:molybdopterin/thiamine biosynthesis adenylyltransferase
MLKNAVVHRDGEDLLVMTHPEAMITLSDPDGRVEALLGLLRDGTRDLAELAAALGEDGAAPTVAEVSEAIGSLDGLGILADAELASGLSADQCERYVSNLAFFDTFASLTRPAVAFQRALLGAHVVFLGTGGVGSSVIQALAGAGVGQMTLLDNDVVEVRNFARQYLYREHDLGTPKVEKAADWVRAFDSRIKVRTVRQWIGGPGDVEALLEDADLVVSGVDNPQDIDNWVNQACVGAGVPFVRGGMWPRRIVYFSVDPGRSACLECNRQEGRLAAAAAGGIPGEVVVAGLDRVNRGIGPVASMVGALVSMEALRYLTGFAPPLAAGRHRFVDLATGEEEVAAWQPWPECPVCQSAPAPRQAPIGACS